MAELERVIEFGIIALIANALGDSAYNNLLVAYPVPQATLAKWVVFGFVLLVYYKLIKVKVSVQKTV